MARQITIDIVGDASKFGRSATDAVNHSNKLSSGFRNSAVAGAAAGLAFGAMDKAIGFVTDALSGASEAAKEDTASQDRLKLAYDNTGKAQKLSVDQIEAIISANQAKGVSDSAQRQGISDFLDLTGSATEAMKLNNSVVELAAAKGIDYASAESMIRSAAAGKTAALQKAGVEIEKGASATEIATAVNDKFGGSLDALAETQGGKAAIANEKMGEAMEKVGRIINELGAVIMPIVADAMVWIVDVAIPPLVAAFDWLRENVLPPLMEAFKRIVDVFKNVFAVIMDIWNTFAALFKGDWNRVWASVKSLAGHAWDLIVSVIVTAVKGLPGLIFEIIKRIPGLIWDAIRAIPGIFADIWRMVMNNPQIASGLFNTLTAPFRLILNFIKELPGRIADAARGMWNGVSTAFKNMINTIIGWWNGLQFTIPSFNVGPVQFGGFSLGMPDIPYLHSGGIVPGVPGADVLTMLQAGERVLPRSGVSGGGTQIHIHIDQGAYIDGPAIDMLTNRIAQRLRFASGT